MSDVLKPLHLKVVFGRKYRFQNVDFSQVAQAPRKVRGRGFSFMYRGSFVEGLRCNHEIKKL